MANLHVVSLTADGKLWHTIRFPNESWQPMFGDVKAQEENDPGPFLTSTWATMDDDLHVVSLTADGKLWHTIRFADGTWNPTFGDVKAQEANDPGPFLAAVCTAAGNDLHVVGLTADGKLWHTIRFANGSWQPTFGDVKAQETNDPGPFAAFGCAGVGNDLHVVGLTDNGRLWHTIRFADGTWNPTFGDVKAQESNNPGSFTSVLCAGGAGNLQVVCLTADGKLWHTIRFANGIWQPTFGDVKAQEQNDPGPFIALGSRVGASRIERTYFWIYSASNDLALTARGIPQQPSAPVLASGRQIPPADTQLWTFANGYIISRLDGSVLDLAGSNRSLGMALITTPKRQPLSTDQQWNVDQDNCLVSGFNGFVATLATGSQGADQPVLSEPKSNPVNSNQQWSIDPYIAFLQTDQDAFQDLDPGSVFSICNQLGNLALEVAGAKTGPGAPVQVSQPQDPPPTSQLWRYEDGFLVSQLGDLALTVTGSNEQPGTPLSIAPKNTPKSTNQQWLLTQDGYLVSGLNQFVASVKNNANAAGTSVVNTAYQPIRTLGQQWYLTFAATDGSDAGSSSTLSVKRSSADVYITKLQVTIVVGNDWFGGTRDKIYLYLAPVGGGSYSSLGRYHLILDAPWAGTVKTMDWPWFSGPISNLYAVAIFQDALRPKGDAWKLQSLTLTVNDYYTNYSFRGINTWINNPGGGFPPQWVGYIRWGAWTTRENQPVDLEMKTYSVRLIPWIGDLKSWRSYDPASIDGVGLLIGVINGRIVGEQLKTRTCEELQPGAYTWVYAPESDTIIYKYWDKEAAKSDYTRHSQLGSGNPVICAGELEIQQAAGIWGVSTVIAMVNDASGHYRPDGGSCLQYMAQKLEHLGIPTQTIQWYWHS